MSLCASLLAVAADVRCNILNNYKFLVKNNLNVNKKKLKYFNV